MQNRQKRVLYFSTTLNRHVLMLTDKCIYIVILALIHNRRRICLYFHKCLTPPLRLHRKSFSVNPYHQSSSVFYFYHPPLDHIIWFAALSFAYSFSLFPRQSSPIYANL